MLVFWIVLCVLGVAFLATAIVFLVLSLVKFFGGAAGGWRSLLESFATNRQPQGMQFKHQTIQVGAVVYKRCVGVAVADEGLFLTISGRNVLIPWHEIKESGNVTLYWQQIPQLRIGEPCIATVAIPVQLHQQMKQYLETAAVQATARDSCPL